MNVIDRQLRPQNFKIDLSLVKPAYCVLDEMRKQMPHKFFVELLGHYISEEDQRRQEVFNIIMKYAEIDGVVLLPNAIDQRAGASPAPPESSC